MPKNVEKGSQQGGASDVARALKRARKASGLSVVKMAKALGMTKGKYQHYEDRYKKPKFEREFLAKVIDIFRSLGVSEEMLAELGDLREAVAGDAASLVEEIRALRQQMAALTEAMAKKTDAN